MAFIPLVTLLPLPPNSSNVITPTITYQSSIEVYGYTSYKFVFVVNPIVLNGEMVGFFFPKNFIGKN